VEVSPFRVTAAELTRPVVFLSICGRQAQSAQHARARAGECATGREGDARNPHLHPNSMLRVTSARAHRHMRGSFQAVPTLASMKLLRFSLDAFPFEHNSTIARRTRGLSGSASNARRVVTFSSSRDVHFTLCGRSALKCACMWSKACAVKAAGRDGRRQ
jgi:hypothetical protein